MADNDAIKNFCDVANVTEAQAKAFLEAANNDLEVTFFVSSVTV